MIRRLEQLTFNKKTLRYVDNTLQVWNKIRCVLLKNLTSVQRDDGAFDNERANNLLQKHFESADEMMALFDLMFEIE